MKASISILAPSRNKISDTSSCSSLSPSYLHCCPVVLSPLSLSHFRSPCLRLNIRSVITAGPKPKAATAEMISRHEDPPIPLLSSLLPPLLLPSLHLQQPSVASSDTAPSIYPPSFSAASDRTLSAPVPCHLLLSSSAPTPLEHCIIFSEIH